MKSTTHASLGIYTKLPSTVSPSQNQSARVARFELQAYARALLPDERVSFCMRSVAPEWRDGIPSARDEVLVVHDPSRMRASYRHLMVCGSVWHCPVCASRISEVRASELDTAIACSEYVPVLVTLTIQHSLRDRLLVCRDRLLGAWDRLKSGRWWQRFSAEFSIVGSVRALEVTYGDHGWHVHLHVLLFRSRDGWADEDVAADRPVMAELLSQQWSSAVYALGGFASVNVGCVVQTTYGKIADYVSKFGSVGWTVQRELVKSVSKRSRAGLSVWDLLRAAFESSGSARLRYRAAWLEYATLFKGCHHLQWSRGLRDLLGVAAVSDTDVAADDGCSVVLAQLPLEVWRRIVALRLRAELLDQADSGDVSSLLRWLSLKVGVVVRVDLARLMENPPGVLDGVYSLRGVSCKA